MSRTAVDAAGADRPPAAGADEATLATWRTLARQRIRPTTDDDF